MPMGKGARLGAAVPPASRLADHAVLDDPNLVTEVEICFIADGTGARVELEHRLEGYGAAAKDMFKVCDGGWQGLLESFVQEDGRAA